MVCLTQGSPPALALSAAIGAIKPTRLGEPEAGKDRGWQIHGHTDDAGPMKPGNRAEEKTLTTGTQFEPGYSKIVLGVWEAVDERRW